jgi:hypothetical protein
MIVYIHLLKVNYKQFLLFLLFFLIMVSYYCSPKLYDMKYLSFEFILFVLSYFGRNFHLIFSWYLGRKDLMSLLCLFGWNFFGWYFNRLKLLLSLFVLNKIDEYFIFEFCAHYYKCIQE